MSLAGGTAFGYFIACLQIDVEDFDGDDFYIKWMIDTSATLLKKSPHKPHPTRTE